MARTVVVVNALGFVEATENDVAEGKDARLLSSLGHRRGHRAHLTKRSSITGVRDDDDVWSLMVFRDLAIKKGLF